MECSPPGSSNRGDSPGKNTGVGCSALLQGIFQVQGLNQSLLCLLHWQAVLTTSATWEAYLIHTYPQLRVKLYTSVSTRVLSDNNREVSV